MHSGLLRSMPMKHFLMSRYFITASMPLITVSLFSKNSRASAVRYGSHSAPLMTRVSTGVLGLSFTAVGKPAPPRPTRPQACTAASRLSLSVTTGGFTAGSTVCSPSGWMVTAGQKLPLDRRTLSTPVTVPETPE